MHIAAARRHVVIYFKVVAAYIFHTSSATVARPRHQTSYCILLPIVHETPLHRRIIPDEGARSDHDKLLPRSA